MGMKAMPMAFILSKFMQAHANAQRTDHPAQGPLGQMAHGQDK
jgi:hypothetical protein